MTIQSEAIRAGIQSELDQLANLSKEFDVVVNDAIRLAADMRDAADRMKAAFADQELDKLIDAADYKLKRGKYVHLRAVQS